MTELDVISVEEAKEWLSTEEETELPRLIASAVDWVENYTGHKLFQRPDTVLVDGSSTTVVGYPVEVISVVDKDGADVPYCVVDSFSGVKVKHGYGAKTITVNVGYESVDKIPPVLIEAAYKMLTYFYENRDLYTVNLPQDVQLMVNKLRRNLV